MTATINRPTARAGSSPSTKGKAKGKRRPAPPNNTFVLLFSVLVVLNLIGLVMILSASSVTSLHSEGSPYFFFFRQLLWLALGSVCFVITLVTDYRRWARYATPLALLGVAGLVLVLVPGVGVNINGSTRWLGFGGYGIQPSEFAKLGGLLFSAELLARRRRKVNDPALTLRPVMVLFCVQAALIMAQPNLGTTIVLAAITFSVLFAAAVPLGPLGKWLAVGVVGATVAALAEPYRRRRMLAFLDPWKDPRNTGYQQVQSLVSIANGGLTGVGVGASRAKWGFLPYAHTDFIFAIIAEELGLVGALAVIGLFVLLGALGMKTAAHAADPFGRLLAVGITTWLCVQAFVNIGAVIGALPITGVPLPFISFGGSSLLSTMAAAGILCSVARAGKKA